MTIDDSNWCMNMLMSLQTIISENTYFVSKMYSLYQKAFSALNLLLVANG